MNQLVIKQIHLATMADDTCGLIFDGALLVEDGKIAWLGPEVELPSISEDAQVFDGQGKWLTPGLIDCHTHLVWGGSRSSEFERRMHGESYESIAQSGGGIMSTVRSTREASEELLSLAASKRIQALISDGVTCVDIKSGYGLNLESEAKILRIARKLGREFPIRVRAGCLAAHGIPPEFKSQPGVYLDLVTEEIFPHLLAHGLVDYVDAFCETVALSRAQVEQIFGRAVALGLPIRLHADQLSDSGGAELAAHFGALSADHLEFTNQSGVLALARSGTVAVLLPGAFYVLGQAQKPPVAHLRQAGVPMAVSTDWNPGTSPLHSVTLAMNMACVLFGLTPSEAWLGVTRHAARALGLGDVGILAPGMNADLALWSVSHPRDICYEIGSSPLAASWLGGVMRSLPPR